MALAKTAYIDESMRMPHGLYVLAAVIVADHHADHHRQRSAPTSTAASAACTGGTKAITAVPS